MAGETLANMHFLNFVVDLDANSCRINIEAAGSLCSSLHVVCTLLIATLLLLIALAGCTLNSAYKNNVRVPNRLTCKS